MEADLSEIAKTIGGQLIGKDRKIEILLTDSRSLTHPEKSLFFALKGESNDGHKYINDLYANGVRSFVVDHIPSEEGSQLKTGNSQLKTDISWILVKDTLKALQKTGSMGRRNAKRVVAITGSRGKTTLKEWLFQMLSPSYNISRSPRSYNSQIGVPLSLWNIRPNSDIAIIEAGVSRHGEMKALAECIQPDTVVITNILDDHDEGFSSREDKIREKVSLAAGESAKNVILCEEDKDLLSEVKRQCRNKKIYTWNHENPDESFLSDDFRKTPVKDYEMENLWNAVMTVISLNLKKVSAAEAAKRLHRIGTRLNVSEGVNNCMLIYDSYTSDQSSLLPALDFVKRRSPSGNGVTVILSDLLHESDSASEAFRSMADMLKSAGVTRLIGIGNSIEQGEAFFAPAIEHVEFFSSTDDFLAKLGPSDFKNETILLKGAPEFEFERVVHMLEARTHETVLEVNLDSVVKNYNYFRSKLPSGTGIVAMVKASGYGAGSYEIARTLQDAGAAYLAVAVLDEGIDLRRRGISMPIMVMNPKVLDYHEMFANRLEPEIYSLPMLRDVVKEAEKYGAKDYPLHIKLDTGMHRMGFIGEELPEVMKILNESDSVRIASAFSHLATADCLDMDGYTRLQLERFDRYTSLMLEKSKRPFLRHVLNSAGILRFPEHHYDMARLGIGLYGVNTLPPDVEAPLAPVSTLRTVIIAIRDWKKGESIGYARRSILERDSRIATIPIGYADGMNRHFGRGNITVRINGKDAPTIGNICMDACMIDVTGIDCKEGDAVEIFGPDASVDRLAALLDTIPYEILTSVSPRVKRIYYRE